MAAGSGGWYGGGPGRSPSGSGGGEYPGRIGMPATGGRAGRGRSAGFGLYASDVGLAANQSLPPEVRAFLDTIGTRETPRGSYSNPDFDPGGLGGRYQFLKSTWVTWARKIGVDPGNFSPENQDNAAFKYADTLARQMTGASLVDLLKRGDIGRAIGAVRGVWNGIYNVDPDKLGHSGAIRLYQKKLHDEQNAVPPPHPHVIERTSILQLNGETLGKATERLLVKRHAFAKGAANHDGRLAFPFVDMACGKPFIGRTG